MTTYNCHRVRFNVNSFLLSVALNCLFHVVGLAAAVAPCPCTHLQCKIPSPGISSLIVTNEVDLATVAHLPLTVMHMALAVKEKLCYDKDEIIYQTCNNGHVDVRDLTGIQSKATCLSDGIWDSPILNCQRKECGKPRVKEMHRLIGGGEFAYGDIITYECTRNFKSLTGYSVCEADGKWSAPPPKCEKLCTEDLHDLNGTITSPNYPKKYPSSINCFWDIKVPEHLNIAIWYRDFKLEVGKYTPINCKHDYFVIMDYGSDNVLQFCGSRVYENYFATGHHMVLTFSSDRIIQDRGFVIQYNTYPKNGKPVEPPYNSSLIASVDDSSDVAHEYSKYAIEILMTALIFIALGTVAMFLILHFVRECGCCHMRYKEPQLDDPELQSYLHASRAKIVYSSHAGDVIRVGNPSISQEEEEDEDYADDYDEEHSEIENLTSKKVSVVSILDNHPQRSSREKDAD